MSAHHVGNAPRFDTLFGERVYYLRWAAVSGQLKVDLKYCPPSNYGAVADLIKRGLLGKKTGAYVPLTEKGRDYLKLHGFAAFYKTIEHDLSMLTEEEADVRGMMILAAQSSNTLWHKSELTDQVRSYQARGMIEMRENPKYFRLQLRPTPAGMAILERAGDKMIRGIIVKTNESYLRRLYTGLSDLLSIKLDRESK